MLVLTISHILPLDIFPGLAIGRILDIFELILDVGRPGDSGLCDGDLLALLILEHVRVIEHALSNQATRNGRVPVWQRHTLNVFLLVVPQVADVDDGVAVRQLIRGEVVSIQLRAVS